MADGPSPIPRRKRILFTALLLGGLALVGWVAFAFGSAGLVLRSGDCAGSTAMDLLLLGWLVLVVAAGAAPPALLLVRGRWGPVLRALAAGDAGVLLYLALAFGALGLLCR